MEVTRSTYDCKNKPGLLCARNRSFSRWSRAVCEIKLESESKAPLKDDRHQKLEIGRITCMLRQSFCRPVRADLISVHGRAVAFNGVPVSPQGGAEVCFSPTKLRRPAKFSRTGQGT